MSKVIRIKGLTTGVTPEEIRQFCLKVGVVDVITPLDDGQAIVTFTSKDAATAAVTQLSGRTLKGSQVTVEWSEGKVSSPEESKGSKLADLLGSFQELSPNSRDAFLAQLYPAASQKSDVAGADGKAKVTVPVDSQKSDVAGAGGEFKATVPVVTQKSEVAGAESKVKVTIPKANPVVVVDNTHGGEYLVHSGPAARVEIPRLPMFSGDTNTKNETLYTQWQYEVMSLENDPSWSSAVIMQAIRRSTKGLAATLLHSLGINASVKQVLEKFDVVFGNVLSGEDLLQEFYTSKQKDGESIAEWSCRLEELAYQAKEKGVMLEAEFDNMIRHQFWRGISRLYVRTGIRHLFDSGAGYNKLVMTARALENEEGAQPIKPAASARKVQQQAIVGTSRDDKLDFIVQELKELKSRLAKMEAGTDGGTRRCYECNSTDHLRNKCPSLGRDKNFVKGKGKQKDQGNGSGASQQGK